MHTTLIVALMSCCCSMALAAADEPLVRADLVNARAEIALGAISMQTRCELFFCANSDDSVRQLRFDLRVNGVTLRTVLDEVIAKMNAVVQHQPDAFREIRAEIRGNLILIRTIRHER